MESNFKSLQKSLEKAFGESCISLASETENYDVATVSSGSINLDLALGKGLPVGRVIEYYGKESVGKTTMALLALKEFQKAYPEKLVGFIDIEHALNHSLLSDLGLDLTRLSLSKDLTGEDAFDLIGSLVISGLYSCICVDSVSALLPVSEQDNTMEQQSMGLQARLIAKGLKKVVPLLDQYGCSLIFLNQLRDNIGAFSMHGTPTTTSGGRALKFYCSVRVEFKKGEPIKNSNKDDVGHVINARCVKNKIDFPNKQATFSLMYAEGINKVEELVDYLILTQFITKGGAWFSIRTEDNEIIKDQNDVELKFQGKDSVVQYLENNSNISKYLLESLENGEILMKHDFIKYIDSLKNTSSEVVEEE